MHNFFAKLSCFCQFLCKATDEEQNYTKTDFFKFSVLESKEKEQESQSL